VTSAVQSPRHAGSAMNLLLDDGCEAEAIRWNPWVRVQPVQFEGEAHALPRGVRLCGPACRVGDRVQITEDGRCVSGRIVRLESSILHVQREAE
jgi:hypothetical protein